MNETQPLFPPPPGEAYTNECGEGGNSGASVEQTFDCNVCLEEVHEPVITQCGHLYCWPCLYRWLNTGHSTCPMCKAGISEENVIPLFTRGSEQDPRSKTAGVPGRPNAHRPEVSSFGGGRQGAETTAQQMSTAYGFFPSLFGLQFQKFARGDEPAVGSEREIIYCLIAIVFVCLIFF